MPQLHQIEVSAVSLRDLSGYQLLVYSVSCDLLVSIGSNLQRPETITPSSVVLVASPSPALFCTLSLLGLDSLSWKGVTAPSPVMCPFVPELPGGISCSSATFSSTALGRYSDTSVLLRMAFVFLSEKELGGRGIVISAPEQLSLSIAALRETIALGVAAVGRGDPVTDAGCAFERVELFGRPAALVCCFTQQDNQPVNGMHYAQAARSACRQCVQDIIRTSVSRDLSPPLRPDPSLTRYIQAGWIPGRVATCLLAVLLSRADPDLQDELSKRLGVNSATEMEEILSLRIRSLMSHLPTKEAGSARTNTAISEDSTNFERRRRKRSPHGQP